MKVLAVVCLLLISVLVLSIIVTAAKQPGFVGSWEAIDVVDGSYEKLVISGGRDGTHRVMVHDSGCSGCSGDISDLSISCTAKGTGTSVGNILTTNLTVRCMGCPSCGINGVVVWPTFTYDPNTDTLEDDIGSDSIPGATWYRLGTHLGTK